MKKSYILGAVALMFTFVNCNGNDGVESSENPVVTTEVSEVSQEEPMQEDKKGMVFDKNFHDFGRLPKGETFEYIFTFVNESDEPLIINDHHVTCGCTVPTYKKGEPIAPGATGSVKVGFRSGVKPPHVYNKTVILKTNQGDYSVRFKIDTFLPEAVDAAGE